MESKRKGINPKLVTLFVLIGILIVAIVTGVIVNASMKKNAYDEAKRLMGLELYEKAIEAFEDLDGYKDSKEQIRLAQEALHQRQQYDDALLLVKTGKYAEAREAFAQMGDYKDAQLYLSRFSQKNVLTSVMSQLNGEEEYTESYTYENGILTQVTMRESDDTDITTFGYYEDGKLKWQNTFHEKDFENKKSPYREVDYIYDASGLLTEETVKEDYEKSTYQYTYDENGNVTERLWLKKGEFYSRNYYVYDAHGQYTQSGFEYEWGAKQDVTYTTEYDAQNRPVRIDSVSAPSGYTESYEYRYDSAGNKIYMKKIEDGKTIYEYAYTYDQNGNLTSETLHKTGENSENTWVTTYTYSDIWTFAELLESK